MPDRSDTELRDEPEKPKILTSDLVYKGSVWDVRAETFEYNGKEIARQFVDHTGAVAVLVMDAEGRVLLIQQYRHPVRLRDWELPAGLLDIAGEDPLVAAKRELAEEADLVATDWSELVSFYSSPGGSNELIRVYQARDVSPAEITFARFDEEADIVKRWVPLADVVAAVLDGRLKNSILAIAVLAAHARA
jgi:8-oxo-dGTP pyrophosphatase MutT (NUDIX family)